MEIITRSEAEEILRNDADEKYLVYASCPKNPDHLWQGCYGKNERSIEEAISYIKRTKGAYLKYSTFTLCKISDDGLYIEDVAEIKIK